MSEQELNQKLDKLFNEWYCYMISDRTIQASMVENEGNCLIEKYQTQKEDKSATLSQ